MEEPKEPAVEETAADKPKEAKSSEVHEKIETVPENTILEPLQAEYKLFEGNDLVLNAKVDSPDRKVKWFKDGQEVKATIDKRIKMTKSDTNRSLTIKKATQIDSASYTMVVVDNGQKSDTLVSISKGTFFIA